MVVTRGIERPEALSGRPVVTLGNFDGVHRGHRALIGRVLDRARSLGAPSLLVTFEPHPLKVLAPARAPLALLTIEQRIDRIASTGVDHLVVVEFTESFASLSPEAFVDRLLVDALHALEIHVGEDFRFGKDRAGDLARLRELGAQHDFEVRTLVDVTVDGRRISSTDVRAAVSAGEIARAAELLGHPVELRGTVVAGDGRGSGLGFPTANLDCTNELLPLDGVYVTEAHVGGETLPGVTNVGRRPTFEGAGHAVETHLFGGRRELVGQPLSLSFHRRLRGEVRFPSVDALIAQIEADVSAARDWFRERESRS